jgi:phosphoribosylamine--glycine ligase
MKLILKTVIKPVIKEMIKIGCPYKGVLYAGIMVTQEGPKVLEFNVRFGDPETQAILPRLKDDLVQVMLAAIDGQLKNKRLHWLRDNCVCVVVSSKGYPGDYEKGKEITGLDEFKNKKDVFVFHAGTKLSDGKVLTSGGRVLGVTALGKNIQEAINKSYEAIKKIRFDGMHFRRDIGARAIDRR